MHVLFYQTIIHYELSIHPVRLFLFSDLRVIDIAKIIVSAFKKYPICIRGQFILNRFHLSLVFPRLAAMVFRIQAFSSQLLGYYLSFQMSTQKQNNVSNPFWACRFVAEPMKKVIWKTICRNQSSFDRPWSSFLSRTFLIFIFISLSSHSDEWIYHHWHHLYYVYVIVYVYYRELCCSY